LDFHEVLQQNLEDPSPITLFVKPKIRKLKVKKLTNCREILVSPENLNIVLNY